MKCNLNSLVRILIALMMIGLPSTVRGKSAESPAGGFILDEQGRQLVPGGYVVLESISYTPDDYQRMVRMGANFQVIRMPLDMIGAWPGTEPDDQALAHFDGMVRMGRDAGLRTIFKLVHYGIQPFGEKQWDMLWHNTSGTQDQIARAWSLIWNRYKDEPSVFGYDLLNEPQRGISTDYEGTQRTRMLPFLRRLTDEMQKISPEKWVLYQPLLRKPEDQWNKTRNPVVAIEEPFGRDRIIYAPHLYRMEIPAVKAILDDLQRQAVISKAPLLLGEWGAPTRANTDGNPTEEARYTKVYQETVNQLDTRGIGGIKAWFCGSRKPIPVKGTDNWMTWSIFSDNSPAGRVERKYITDVVARPRPLVVAGRLIRYGNDFTTPCFEMTLDADPGLGATEIFVAAERHFPNGFQVEVGAGLIMASDLQTPTLQTVQAISDNDREQTDHIQWKEDCQRLIIERWAGPARRLTLTIRPKSP